MAMVKTIDEFVSIALSQHEASLIIAETEDDRDKVLKILEKKKFKRLTDPRQLEKKGKYLVLTEDLSPANIYSLFVQYATGQLSLFDPKKQEPFWVNPVYKGSALVCVTSKSSVRAIELAGFHLRAASGLALQV